MSDIMRSTNQSIKFQILAEIAANQPDIQQRDIAKRMNLSPQAISDYVRELVKDGWLSSEGRSKYKVTKEGVDWMVKGLREWQSYSDIVLKAIAGISVCAAIADKDIAKGQKVRLTMKEGLLFATTNPGTGAAGIAVASAKKGEDVGVSNIDGIVPLEIGRIQILRLPAIQRGGSSRADLNKMKKIIKSGSIVGAIGIESLVTLQKLGVKPEFLYGVKEAVVEAARSGLFPIVLCVDDDTSDLIKHLEAHGIQYDIMNISKG